MKIRKKLYVMLLTLMLILCGITTSVYAACGSTEEELDASTVSVTAAQALEWVHSKAGVGIDVDGYYGCQCVDFIMAYYDYLVGYHVSGNGKDYATNTLPSGWSRVQGGTPQPGDILVYSATSSNAYGHVAIYEGDYCTWHQNYNSHSYVECVTNVKYNGNWLNNYWGYIRPNWNTHTHSYSSAITQAATCMTVGVRTYTCSCGASYKEIISALEHNYQKTKVVDPTETSKGYTLYTCSRCGATKTDNYTDALKVEDGWTYASALPTYVNSSDYTIQYNNTYKQTGSSTPGSGWTLESSVWQNVGDPYSEYTTVNTSDTKVLLYYYYYHYCSGSTGEWVNYTQTSTYIHYDALPTTDVTILSTGTDNDSADIPTFKLSQYCQSGTTCSGYGDHGQRSCYWYRMNVYQNRTLVNTYTKTSGWVSSQDSAAASVSIRFKHNHSYTSKVTKKATCTTKGVRTYTCSCGASYTKSIAATGHTLKTTVTKATPSKAGSKVTKCTVCGTVTKTVVIARPTKFTLSTTKYTYNGKVKKPTLKVYNSSGKLIDSANYTITYPSGRKNVGTYTYKVTFKGSTYSGTKSVSFTIVPKKATVKSVTVGTDRITVYASSKASTLAGSGYQIAYRVSGTTKWTYIKTTASSRKITGLKTGKKYQVKIRAYKTVSGKTYYGSWSTSKTSAAVK